MRATPRSTAADSRGVADVVGYAILVGVIVALLGTVTVLGSAALSDTQERSQIGRAEHTMTLLDSRAAMVALGSSDTQTVRFGADSGRYETQPNRGWLAIQHHNHSDAGADEEVFNRTLGAFVYRAGETAIAYQGGGVWRQSDDGQARMLSPPEFHYRAATLTLPVVRVTGSQGAAVAPRTTITADGSSSIVYPSSRTYNATGERYANPIRNGTVEVQVRSEYYRGWADYFRDRTSGVVEVFDHNRTVHLRLVSLSGSLGRFPIPSESSDGVEVDGLASGHSVTDFSVNLSEGQTSGGENHWALYSTEGFNEFELHIEPDFNNCEARISVYYHNTSTGEREEWQTAGAVTDSTTAIDCTGENMSIDFTDDSVQIEYDEIDGTTGSGTKFCFGTSIRDHNADTMTLTEHPVDPGASKTFTPDGSSSESLNFTVNHYLGRLGRTYNLRVKDAQGNFCPSGAGPGGGGGSDTVDEDASVGMLTFKESTSARFVTYLHVTENRVTVELD